MSISKCAKCGKSIFQVESMTPIGSNRDVLCVICHNCNSVVGTIDHKSNTDLHEETDIQIKVMQKKLDTINHNIGQLMNGMKILYTKLESKN